MKKIIILIVPQTVDPELVESGVVYRHYIDKSHLREYSLASLKKLAGSLSLKIAHIKDVHPLYNETIFLALFGGPPLLKKILRKIVLIFLGKKNFPTELFMVADK